MALPDCIEVSPLGRPVKVAITVPGSKSITNRALILAALASGETVLQGALWSEDTQVMVECLQELGFMVNVAADPAEKCNRTITVYGKGGVVPRGGSARQPLDLFVGNAGTAARFLAALCCLGEGAYRLHGVPRMHERPQAALFNALRQLGYQVDSPNDKLPALIHGGGPRPGACRVSIAESSQFASALLLGSEIGKWRVDVDGENRDESPYVQMTTRLLERFPRQGGAFQIEPDASGGSYFWAIAPGVTVKHWPASGWQIDQHFAPLAARLFAEPSTVFEVSRQTDLGDSIMTAIVLAAVLGRHARFTDLGRLRLQECERVVALRTELTRCGAVLHETGDTLTLEPSVLHGADIQTYNDHRMAMCFAVVGLAVPGIRIHHPACVKKTFPNFFEKLAAPPPFGLGAMIREPASGRVLVGDDLFAD